MLISSAPAVDYQPVKQNPSDPLGVWFVKRCRLQILRFFPRQRPQKKSRASLHPFVKRCTALHLFKQKIETIIPGKKALTALRKTSVNKNSRTSSQDLNENFTQSSKKDLIEGIWQDLCTRTSWRLPLQTFIQAPSRSSRKYLLEDSSRMCARSPHKHLYNKGFH